MKKIQYIIIFLFALAIVFNGCKKDDKSPVLDLTATVAPAWVDVPADTTFVLVKDSADVVVTTLEWTDVVYSVSDLPSPLYTIQLYMATDIIGGSAWGEPIELLTQAELVKSFTNGELNTMIVKQIGSDFPEDTVVSVGFQIKANVNANGVSTAIDAFSEISAFSVTPYAADVPAEVATLWVPGDYQGWNPSEAPNVFDYDNDGIYRGYIYFPEGGTFEFKFTSDPDWEHTNYGLGASEFEIDTDPGAGNLTIPGPGGYWLEIDINALTWSYEGTENWGVIGQWLEWSEDIDLEFDPIEQYLHVTVENIPAQEDQRFKFRADDDWAVNLGANDPDDGFLVQGGADIPIPNGGTITFILDFTTEIPSYRFIEN